jgi:hypothetical protein
MSELKPDLSEESPPPKKNQEEPPASRGALPGTSTQEKACTCGEKVSPSPQPANSLLPKTIPTRRSYLEDIEGVRALAREKILNRWTRQDLKLSWCRVAIAAIAAGGDLLRDVELDELAGKIEKIELEAKHLEK